MRWWFWRRWVLLLTLVWLFWRLDWVMIEGRRLILYTVRTRSLEFGIWDTRSFELWKSSDFVSSYKYHDGLEDCNAYLQMASPEHQSDIIYSIINSSRWNILFCPLPLQCPSQQRNFGWLAYTEIGWLELSRRQRMVLSKVLLQWVKR